MAKRKYAFKTREDAETAYRQLSDMWETTANILTTELFANKLPGSPEVTRWYKTGPYSFRLYDRGATREVHDDAYCVWVFWPNCNGFPQVFTVKAREYLRQHYELRINGADTEYHAFYDALQGAFGAFMSGTARDYKVAS